MGKVLVGYIFIASAKYKMLANEPFKSFILNYSRHLEKYIL